jgi:23S rRNA pseudouridine2605 synthase
MVFKRPGNSRDDKSTRSPNKNLKSDDQPKKTGTSRYGKPTSTSKLKRNHYSDDAGGGQKSAPPARRKPYSGRPDADDRPARPSSTGRTPYRDKAGAGERAKRSPGSYRGGDAAAEKKSYAPKRVPYSDRPASDDRPKRSTDNYRAGSEPSGERKFSARPGPKSSESTGNKKFGGRPGTGFRKRDDDFKDKPFRKSENSSYNKPKIERSANAKPLRSRKATEGADRGLIRLNRYISNAGICSRRKADELISAGVISVNGEVVSELGHKVDPQKDMIRYNGELLKREKMVYVLLNKPKDYITTTDDPQERRTVMHLVEKASKERIYPIGRLDRNTTGLLLMTNDGDLADKLSHPKNNIVKLYHVELNKNLTQGDLNKIGFGLELEDGFIKPDMVSYVQGATKKEIGIQIHSGKNRIVRRIFEHLGYEVVKLDRAVYANLTKKDLPRGRWRYLDEKEVIQLKHLI